MLYDPPNYVVAVFAVHIHVVWNSVYLSQFFLTYRKDFRPAYSKLNLLGTFMPNIPILALTATATLSYQTEIKRMPTAQIKRVALGKRMQVPG